MIWMLKTVNWKFWSEIVHSLVASLRWIFQFRLCYVVDGPRYSKNDIRILAFKRTTSDTGEEHLMGSYVLGVSPSLIWSHTISTYWSRSGRLCSCQNPVMKSSKWIEFLYEARLKYRLNYRDQMKSVVQLSYGIKLIFPFFSPFCQFVTSKTSYLTIFWVILTLWRNALK